MSDQQSVAQELSDHQKLAHDGWKRPLLALPPVTRLLIGELFVHLSVDWPDMALLDALLERLDLQPPTAGDELRTRADRLRPSTALAELSEQTRWAIVWELLFAQITSGCVDARVHVTLQRAARLLRLPLKVRPPPKPPRVLY